MKRIIFLLFVLALSAFVVADEQPSLLNHQFYGEVTWAENSVVPSTLTATLEGAVFSSEIRSSPCLTDPCKGQYGFDPDNILRVQGVQGGEILFIIDGVEVGEHEYTEDEVTKLDFDLRAEVKKTEPSGFSEEELLNETVEEPILQEPVITKKVEPKKIPEFKMPTTFPSKAVEEKKGLSVNFYLIGGILLVLAAIAVIIYLVIKKKRKEESEI